MHAESEAYHKANVYAYMYVCVHIYTCMCMYMYRHIHSEAYHKAKTVPMRLAAPCVLRITLLIPCAGAAASPRRHIRAPTYDAIRLFSAKPRGLPCSATSLRDNVRFKVTDVSTLSRRLPP